MRTHWMNVFTVDGSGSLLLEVLSEWLNENDVVQFDTAVSCRGHRKLLESCYLKTSWKLQSVIDCCHFRSEDYECIDPYLFFEMAAWVAKRGIHVIDNSDQWTMIDDDFYEEMQHSEAAICAPFLTKLNITTVSILESKESLRRLLTTFPNIEKLALNLCTNDNNTPLASRFTAMASFWRLKDIACGWYHSMVVDRERYSFLLGCRDTLEVFSPAPNTTKREFLYIIDNLREQLQELHLPEAQRYNELHMGYSPQLDQFTPFIHDVCRLTQLKGLSLHAPLGWSIDDAELLVRRLPQLKHLELLGSIEMKSDIPIFHRVLTFCKEICYFRVGQNKYLLEAPPQHGQLTLWDSMELGKDNFEMLLEVLNLLPCLHYLQLFPAEDVFHNPLLSKALGLSRHKLTIHTLHMPFKAKQLHNAMALLAALPALTALTVKFRSAVKADWVADFVDAVIRSCPGLRSLTVEGIDGETLGLSPVLFKKLVCGLSQLTSLHLSNCKSPQLDKHCLLEVAHLGRLWDVLSLPATKLISLEDLRDVVGTHGLAVKKVQISTERPWRCYRVSNGVNAITLARLEAFLGSEENADYVY